MITSRKTLYGQGISMHTGHELYIHFVHKTEREDSTWTAMS